MPFAAKCQAEDSLYIKSLFHWKAPQMTRTIAHKNAYNEIWGYAQDGREYAIIGSTRGTHIFDVTEPENSSEVAFIMGRDTGSAIVHRDYHDYKGYLYAISDEGNSSLQIIDLSGLPNSVNVVYDGTDIFTHAHNIFIDTLHGKLYQAGGRININTGNHLSVYDLSDPERPERIIDLRRQSVFWQDNVGYVHDLFVRDNIAYVNDQNAAHIIDFSVTTNPQLLGTISNYPHKGYNHSGWLSDDGSLYAMADETHGTKTKVFDVSDFGNIEFMDTVGARGDFKSLPHNVIFRQNILFIANYVDGLYIYDFEDPKSPKFLGFYDMSFEPHTFGYRGNWGVYPFLPSGNILVSDMQEGLFVLKADSVKYRERSVPSIVSDKNIHVSPNPSTGNISLRSLAFQSKTYAIRLFDLNGKLIYTSTLGFSPYSSVNLQLNGLSPGMYLLDISDESYTQREKLIIR